MTDTPTTDTPDAAPAKPARRSSGGLGGKVLAELQEIATELGIADIQGMRKGALIDAIKAARGEAQPTPAPVAEPAADQPQAEQAKDEPAPKDEAPSDRPRSGQSRAEKAPQDQGQKDQGQKDQSQDDRSQGEKQDDQPQNEKAPTEKAQSEKAQSEKAQNEGGGNRRGQQNKGNNQGGQQNKGQNQGGQNNQNNQNNQGGQNAQDDDEEGGGRRRNRRGRNRNRGMEAEPTYAEDDVLVPAAGILDILDNYAFVRTTGYLPSDQDVYVSLSMVRKWGLRRGDAITGQVRQPREGERKEKFNPMVKVETVNGLSLEESDRRPELTETVAVHPTERLRLETSADEITGRVIDLVAPLGKGQRGLVVAPTGAGKTTVLRRIADAVTANHPEAHLMVVLVDERPEEVTDFVRGVKGEVVASAFDHTAADHTTAAELAVERAKRLVELGHDVVVLVDGITRLGRSYHHSSSSRQNSGVDLASLHPVKRLFGAARNVEDGGSLTILATQQVGSGSPLDDAVAEELSGTGTWELRLSGDLARRRAFPAIDVAASGTLRDDLLLDAQEQPILEQLHRVVADLDAAAALDLVVGHVTATSTNAEALLRIRQA